MATGRKYQFRTVLQADVPHGRNGKHKQLITEILDGLKHLKPGAALKIPLKDIASKEKVRSALNRASRNAKIVVATAADAEFLYVWNSSSGDAEAARPTPAVQKAKTPASMKIDSAF